MIPAVGGKGGDSSGRLGLIESETRTLTFITRFYVACLKCLLFCTYMRQGLSDHGGPYVQPNDTVYRGDWDAYLSNHEGCHMQSKEAGHVADSAVVGLFVHSRLARLQPTLRQAHFTTDIGMRARKLPFRKAVAASEVQEFWRDPSP